MNFYLLFVQSSVSHDPSEIIIICWFGAQVTYLIIINAENRIHRIHWWIKGLKEQDLFELEIFSNIINVFTVPFVTLHHKTGLKSLGYICSNSQKYIVWVKIINFSFMPKIIRILRNFLPQIYKNVIFLLVICIAELIFMHHLFQWKAYLFRRCRNLNLKILTLKTGFVVRISHLNASMLNKSSNYFSITLQNVASLSFID